MKKTIALTLCLTLLLGMALPGALAAGTPTVSISSGTVKAGESVTLTVSIEDNPGISGTLLYLYFDTAVFGVDLNSGMMTAGTFRKEGGMVTNSIEVAKANGPYSGDWSRDGVLAIWYNSLGMDTDADGAMLYVTFTAKASAPNGKYEIDLDYSAADTGNQSGENVALTTVSGSITVTGGTENADPVPEEPEDEPITFTDIYGHWAEAEILKSAELGLVNGMGDGLYCPDDTMTRAMCVTILWRAAGCPEPKGAASFTDLDPKQSWYLKAVAWAEENAVVNGIGNGKFDPNGSVTREQLVTILHRLAGTPIGMELMFAAQYDAAHPDSGKVSDYAKNAVYWAIYKNILCGDASAELKTGAELKPTAPATRAQIAVMMVRYLDKY